MNKILLGALIAVVAIGVVASVVIYSGIYNVAASEPHSVPFFRLLETARIRSIESHAKGIVPPGDLAKPERLVAGVSHYAEHCANCHGAPGVEPDDMAEGMYPKPPKLADVSKRLSPAELFWILKNGIKMTGMPSWGDHSDDDLWNTVAFLQKLPGMSPDAYHGLTEEAEAAGGHHMHGGMDMPMPAGSDKPAPADHDEHH
jgi:mono/diheme cytochrome c family protein